LMLLVRFVLLPKTPKPHTSILKFIIRAMKSLTVGAKMLKGMDGTSALNKSDISGHSRTSVPPRSENSVFSSDY